MKQIWNNKDVVANTVAIIEQWQTGFCTQQLKDCYLKFPKIKDTGHTFSIALILSYKRSTGEKKRGEPSLKEKSQRKTKEK